MIRRDDNPRPLGPGERMIDGVVYYSAAWLDDPVSTLALVRADQETKQLRCNFAPENPDPKEAA
jgi:hypothetical protein